MGLVDRAKNMIVSPKTEWDVVAAEATPPGVVITGYALPLAALYAIAAFVGSALVLGFLGGFGGIAFALAGAVVKLVVTIVMLFVLAFIVDALAPTFSGQKNYQQAFKVATYSHTPVWIFGLLTIIPFLGWLAVLVGAIYAVYILYLGLPKLMKVPEEKAVGYTVVVIVVAIVLGVVVGVVGASVAALGHLGSMGMGGLGRTAPAVVFDRDSRVGRMNEFAAKMEEASKKMEAAQKTGDPNKQMEAAMGALGTAISGGKGVEPVQLDALKPLLPDTFAGLPRTSQRSDRSGMAGLMVAKVSADYGDNAGKTVQVEIVDTGGAAGLMGLAAWAALGANSESEDDNHIERMHKEGNRFVREQQSKRQGTNAFSLILADRFMVQAEGRGVDLGTLKSGVGSLDLGKIESLK